MCRAQWLAILLGIGTIWFTLGFIQKSLRMIEQGGGELLYRMPLELHRLFWIPILQVGLHYTVAILAGLPRIVYAVRFKLIGHLYREARVDIVRLFIGRRRKIM